MPPRCSLSLLTSRSQSTVLRVPDAVPQGGAGVSIGGCRADNCATFGRRQSGFTLSGTALRPISLTTSRSAVRVRQRPQQVPGREGQAQEEARKTGDKGPGRGRSRGKGRGQRRPGATAGSGRGRREARGADRAAGRRPARASARSARAAGRGRSTAPREATPTHGRDRRGGATESLEGYGPLQGPEVLRSLRDKDQLRSLLDKGDPLRDL